MASKISANFVLHPDVSNALQNGYPVVALESTVITHGLPSPVNLELAKSMEETVRSKAVPATIALLSGKIKIGLTEKELQSLAQTSNTHKISTRDLSIAAAKGWDGGTTVSATLFAAHKVGIKIFATGGIGGVHRGSPFDESADLMALSHTPLVVVCSGAKAILDLPATREKLESYGIPVIGYQTEELPAFYSRSSGLAVDFQANSPEEIASIAKTHWDLGMRSALLVVNPPPEENSLSPDELEVTIQQAMQEARDSNISGSAVTPFLLDRVSSLSQGRSLQANLDLLSNNAHLAAEISGLLYQRKGIQPV